MEITSPEPQEVAHLADLWVVLARGQQAFGTHLAPEANRTAIQESLAKSLAADQVLVARTAGDIVGFVTFDIEHVRYEQDVTRGIVQNLYVDPERRRDGIGSALLSAAEERLWGHGVDVVALEAMADNEAARQFYRDRGYVTHRVELEKELDGE